MRALVLILCGCVPLPVPASPDVDYCAHPPVMLIEDWRVLCGQRPMQLAVTDGGLR